MGGSLTSNSARHVEVNERIVKGTTSCLNGRKSDQATPRNTPSTCPALVNSENLAKAVAHISRFSVSSIRRLREAVDADVVNDSNV
jgi:hypothetical protein